MLKLSNFKDFSMVNNSKINLSNAKNSSETIDSSSIETIYSTDTNITELYMEEEYNL